MSPREEKGGASSEMASEAATPQIGLSGGELAEASKWLVARRSEYHRSVLVDAISSTDLGFRMTDRQFSGFLSSHGLGPDGAARTDLAMINSIINRQSTMMAYNDCFWLMVPMFMLATPLLLLLPKRGVPESGEHPID
jgi:DHA2 family multidrug resistance protein